MKPRKALLAFKRLNLADVCFKRAEALAQYVNDENIETTGLLYSPMIAGIVVTYMRPFLQSDGLGPLDDDFEDFVDSEMEQMHAQIEESRHKLYAHQDLLFGQTLPTDDGSTPFKMSIDFEDVNKGYAIATGNIEINPENLVNIVKLCKLQQKRVTSKIRVLLPILTIGKSYPAGKYTIGVDFP